MNIHPTLIFHILPLLATVDIVFFLATISLHTAKKNSTLVMLYLVQSLLLSVFLFSSSLNGGDHFLLYAALTTFFIKVVLAPWFFFRFIGKNRLFFASGTYLGTSLTLCVIFLLSIISYSVTFHSASFNAISENIGYAPLHLAGLLSALFVTVNRKEALAQIIGILAVENWVVYIAALTGFRQTLGLDMAITFEIIVWVVIAIVFALLLKRHFGTFDVMSITRLREGE